MKQLRVIRVFLAALFFAAASAYLMIGPRVHPLAAVSFKSQVVLSAVSVSIGAALVWLVLTFLFGRIYCSTVCPIGTLSDIFIRLRKYVPRLNRPFSYRPRRVWSVHVLLGYLICLTTGLVAVPYLVEPWNIMRNIASAVNPSAVETTWIALGLGAVTGVAAGIISLLLIAVWSAVAGRGFCTDFCPMGTAMGLLHEHTLYHIEIDPDRCTSCGLCEDVCKSQCIKTVSRYVDNSRCVRCFDCVAKCPEEAIRFQQNRNRRVTPLMRKVKKSTP